MTKIAAAIDLPSAFGNEPADKRMEILRQIGASGSISQAARDAGVSYKAAWQAIDTLTNLAGVVLVERAVGGSGGGGATLTRAGQQMLSTAQQLNQARSQVFASLARSTSGSAALSGMGVRTSMRNQLPCSIARLELKGQVMRVHLSLASGVELVSRITKASAELLSLRKGQQVLALCKATAVCVRAESGLAVTGNSAPPQVLGGKAVRVSPGASGDEVSLQLDAGLQLVGFAAAGSKLKAGARVSALVEESAWVIAFYD